MPRRLPDEKIAAIKALRAKGHSISEICAELKLHRSVVHRHCEGIRLPNGPLKRGPKFTLSRAACLKLRNEGLSFREIAVRVGRSYTAVRNAIVNRRSAA